MWLNKIELENFLCFNQVEAKFGPDKIYLVLGQNNDTPGADSNGSGKSAFFDAISWALFGRVPRKITADEIIYWGKEEVKAKITLVENGNEYFITREKSKKGNRLELKINNKDASLRTPTETQKVIYGHLNLNPIKPYEDFLNMIYFPASLVKSFASRESTASQRLALISRFLELERFDEASKLAKGIRENWELDKSNFISQKKSIGVLEDLGELNLKQKTLFERVTILKAILAKDEVKLEDVYKVDKIRSKISDLRIRVKTINDSEESYLNQLRNQFYQVVEKINEAKKIQKILLKKKKDLSNLKVNESKFRIRIDNLNNEINKLNQQTLKVSNEVSIFESEISKIRKMVSKGLVCPKCQSNLMVVEEKLELFDLRKANLQLKEVVSRKDHLVSVNRTNQGKIEKILNTTGDLQRKIDYVENLETEVNEISIPDLIKLKEELDRINSEGKQKKLEIEKQVSEINIEIKELESIILNYEEINLIDLKKKIEVLRSELGTLNSEMGGLDVLIERTTSDLKKSKQLDSQIQKTDDKIALYYFWEDGFKEIREEIIEECLPKFEYKINDYLNSLESGLYVRFLTSLSNQEVQSFKILIGDDLQNERYFEACSTGEMKKISLCLGLARKTIISEANLNKFDFLLFDEVIDSLDFTGMTEFYNILLKIPGQKFVISHSDIMKSFIPDCITIVKEDGKSVIK